MNFGSLNKQIQLEFARSNVDLPYHGTYKHTEQVTEATIYIINKENEIKHGIIDKDMRNWLITAANTHDIGNLVARENHEQLSIDWNNEHLPKFSYNQDDINTVNKLVEATELYYQLQNDDPQIRLMQEIIRDADMSSMGYSNFMNIIDAYRKELGIEDGKEWHTIQYQFLTNHKWHRESSRQLFDQTKQQHIAHYKQLLGKF